MAILLSLGLTLVIVTSSAGANTRKLRRVFIHRTTPIN